MEIRAPSRIGVEGFEVRGQCQGAGKSREGIWCTPIKGKALDQRRPEVKY